ncbi:MAG: hypothetical protein ACRD0A_19575 [Acidimicrobiales bacterium]
MRLLRRALAAAIAAAVALVFLSAPSPASASARDRGAAYVLGNQTTATTTANR